MVNNIINSSIRSLLNNRFFLFINLLGLTIGLACFILILAFVIDEQKFDKHFNDAENIYRIYLNAKIAGSPLRTTSVPPALADALKDDFPEVEETLRVTGTTFDGNPELIKIDGHPFHESKILYADSNVISFFGLKVLNGGVDLLNKPNNVIVTVACARRYFGTDAAIGRTIEVPRLGISFIVTGIVEELPPQSHFHFDMIASLLSIESVRAGRWLGGSVKTYAKISSTVKANELMARASPQIVKKFVAPQLQEFMGISFGKFIDDGGIYEFCAQPLTGIHLRSNLDKEWEPNSNSLYVQVAIFTLIGILLIAGVNYANLSTSKSLARAKEIGVRKVLGSSRNQLMMQFLTEAVILTVMALVFAFLVSAIVLPYFNQMLGKAFSISTVLNVRLIGTTIAVAVVLGLISGLYPAVFMSAFDPIKVLKGDIPRGNGWRGVVKNVLVILQLTVTFAVLTFAVVVNLQLNFLKNKDLGFNKEQIIIIKNTNYLKQQSNSFIERLLKIPGIQAASYSSFIPGKNVSRAAYQPGDTTVTYVFPLVTVDHRFLDVYNIKIKEGRGFLKDNLTDTSSILMNEAALASMGKAEEVGLQFNANMMGATPITLIGITKDFHFRSLHNKIEPISIEYKSDVSQYFYCSIRIDAERAGDVVVAAQELWREYSDNFPFEYFFFDKEFEKLYENESRLSRLVYAFSIVLLVITILGLFALTLYLTETRKREVGIRRVIGGSVSSIVWLYKSQLLLLVVVSLAISTPLVILGSDTWLSTFAFREKPGVLPYVVSSVVIISVVIATSAYHVIKASLANPVSALRNN